MNKLENSFRKDKKQEDLSRFLLKSAVAEEYILGKILTEVAKVPELKEYLDIEDIDMKLEYFNKFLKKECIYPEEYDEFRDKRMCLASDGYYLMQGIQCMQQDKYITCFFLDFENLSHPLINRVINNLTARNSINFRTMILTRKDEMLTTYCRDEGYISDPYEYRQYSLNKARKLTYEFPWDKDE